jgi:hypothetical protein
VSKAVDNHNSLKLNYSNGLTARVGTSFQTISIVWQYAWFDK